MSASTTQDGHNKFNKFVNTINTIRVNGLILNIKLLKIHNFSQIILLSFITIITIYHLLTFYINCCKNKSELVYFGSQH